jgi:ATP-binding cassette subfamily C (CFTR/MRP) protein 1
MLFILCEQVKRMEAVSRSPIYTHFSETVTGCSTIRAFDRTESFITENERKVDHCCQVAEYSAA